MKWTIAALICMIAGCQPAVEMAKPIPVREVSSSKIAQPREPGSLQIYFVRHGETVANATGIYNGRTLQAFSKRGAQQVAALIPRLHNIHFDAAIVSPSLRAEKTIAGILRDHHMKAEIWPEFNECCDGPRSRRNLPPRNHVLYDGPILVPKGYEDILTVPAANRRMLAYGTYQDGLIQIKLAADRMLREYGHKPVSLLIVGHSLHGGRFLERLLGLPVVGRIRPDNASVTHLVQSTNGSFKKMP